MSEIFEEPEAKNPEVPESDVKPAPAKRGRKRKNPAGSRGRGKGSPEKSALPQIPAETVSEAPPRDGSEKSARKKSARKSGRGKRLPKQPLPGDAVGAFEKVSNGVAAVEVVRRLLEFPALPCGTDVPCLPPQPLAPSKRQSKKQPEAKAGSKKMFISIIPGEQVEVGLAEEGVLLEYYLDMLHQSKLKGNIYKGVIQNIDVNLQAAFVNFGSGKNGFLQIAEVHPEYWESWHEPLEPKRLPPIQKILKIGQEVLVQVVKEPAGNKGAFLTTWLSLAGRFLVLTPGQEQIGVSRKVTDQEERARLREMMNGIDPGSGFGVIVRTVGEGATKTTLKNDLQYLKRLWKEIRKKATEVSAPALLYQEPRLSERAVRDYLTDEVAEIWVDDSEEARYVRDMVNLLFPRKKNLVHLHESLEYSLWERFNLVNQLDEIYQREVMLPSGGRLVFDQTEALLAIDINSGKISGKSNFESMAFKTNMEASEVIARQLRLRDVGGQVVIDFIEMRDKKHIMEVEKTLRQAMRNDRARHDIARMSSFGLLELVRQRMGSSALSITMETCAACGGTGLCRNLEWQALQILRELRRKMKAAPGEKLVFDMNRELGLYVLNHKREALGVLEKDFGKTLEIKLKF